MLVRADDLVKVYRRGTEEIHALSGVEFEISEGEFVCLLGPSGAGKTTTLNLIGLMDVPTSGSLHAVGHQISQNGARLSENMRDHLRRANIGFIFSEFFLVPTLTAMENVQMPLLWSGKSDPDHARQLLERVGLEHRLTHHPGELSGGEMQRVAIARALINRPRLLLADEPTGNLDTRTRDSIFELFRELNQQDGLTILLATHDRELADRVDRVIHLDDGRVATAS